MYSSNTKANQMNIILWIVQILLAAMYLFAGSMKTLQSRETLIPKMPWTKDFSAGTIKFIGISEILASLGLVLPWLTGILPILTPLAATGLGLIMILAAGYHIRKKETGPAVMSLVLFLLAIWVAYGRR